MKPFFFSFLLRYDLLDIEFGCIEIILFIFQRGDNTYKLSLEVWKVSLGNTGYSRRQGSLLLFFLASGMFKRDGWKSHGGISNNNEKYNKSTEIEVVLIYHQLHLIDIKKTDYLI